MSSKGRCTTTSIYLPTGPFTLTKTDLSTVCLFACHPLTGKITRIMSWKDVRDISRAAERAHVAWEHTVLLCDQEVDLSESVIAEHLAGRTPRVIQEGVRRIYLDEDTARGRQILPSLIIPSAYPPTLPTPTPYSPELVERTTLIKWLATTTSALSRDELRKMGAPQIAHLFFGDKTRRDTVAAVGTALTPWGPTGALGTRHSVVALAAALSDLLSADRLVDVLHWPAGPPERTWSPATLHGLTQLMGPMSDLQRHKIAESLAACSVRDGLFDNALRGFRDRDYDYDDDRDWDNDLGDIYFDANGDRRHADPRDPYLALVEDALTPYAPDLSGRLRIDHQGSVLTPNTLPDQIALAGALTEAALAAGLTLPAPPRDFNERLNDLLRVALPSAITWRLPDTWSRLVNLSVPGYAELHLVMPSSPSELTSWGDTMHNCISSYGAYVDSGRTILAAVRNADGEMIANVSVSLNQRHGAHQDEWSVEQVAGPYNAELDPELEGAISNLIMSQLREYHTPQPVLIETGPLGGILAGATPLPTALSLIEDIGLDIGDPHEALDPPPRSLTPRSGRRTPRSPTTLAPPPENRGVMHSLGANLSAMVPASLVESVCAAGSPNPDAARRALALLASRDALGVRDVIDALACYDPATAYLDNERARGVRDALAAAQGGDLEPLAHLRAGADPEVAASIGAALVAWFSATLTGAITHNTIAQRTPLDVMTSRGPVKVVLGDPHIVLDPRGDIIPLHECSFAREVLTTLGLAE